MILKQSCVLLMHQIKRDVHMAPLPPQMCMLPSRMMETVLVIVAGFILVSKSKECGGKLLICKERKIYSQ